MKKALKGLGNLIKSILTSKERKEFIKKELIRRAENDAILIVKAQATRSFIENKISNKEDLEIIKDPMDSLIDSLAKESFLSGMLHTHAVLAEKYGFTEKDLANITAYMTEGITDPNFVHLYENFKVEKTRLIINNIANHINNSSTTKDIVH